MLPRGLWRPWEPRAVFPFFAEAENTFDFVVQEAPRPSLRSLARVGVAALRRQRPASFLWRDGLNVLLARGLAFRGAFLTRDGQFVRDWSLSAPLQAGEFFSANVNRLLEESGVAPVDGLFILIASRGRLDRWSSSPGSATARYVGTRYVAGFRTGLFARALNPARGARHVGFTGINPQVIVSDEIVASVLLMNHSSDPEYDRAVSPTIRLYRDRGTYLEAPFGEIPPHGARERSMTELFPQAVSFLAPNGGRGLSIARAPGATLASVHLLRSRDGGTLGLDHSRPAYANVVA